MIIYTPIYLYTHLGFNWKQIGFIFAIMLVPFLFIPFQAGKYVDRVGERRILMYGFTITALFTLLLFYIHGHSVWIWALMLFITRIGAASVEVTSDAYFFKHIVSKNDEFVGVYRSASPVAYILGPLCAFVIFIFVPAFNYIYLILSVIMLFGIYLSSTIEKRGI
jgi:MFS family permease